MFLLLEDGIFDTGWNSMVGMIQWKLLQKFKALSKSKIDGLLVTNDFQTCVKRKFPEMIGCSAFFHFRCSMFYPLS